VYYFPNSWGYRREVIAFGLLTSILLVLITLFNTSKARKYIVVLCNIILSSLVFVKLSFYHQFGAKINASALFVVFETNKEEASDFIADFINIPILILFMTLMILSMVLIKLLLFSTKFNVTICIPPMFCFKSKLLKTLVLILLFLSSYVIYTRFYDENIIIEGISSYSEYLDLKERFKNDLAKKESKNIKVSPNNGQATYIVIIGESTSNWHMQLYGYNRETNPLLSKIKDELIIFKDVISPNTHTQFYR